jgi:hypothetical protein
LMHECPGLALRQGRLLGPAAAGAEEEVRLCCLHHQRGAPRAVV